MAELCVLAAVKALASAAASPAISYLGQQVADLLGVQDKMRRIKNSLESIQSILRFADQKAVDNPLVRDWINKVRDVSFMVEDVLDNHMYGTSDRGNRGRVFDFIKRSWHRRRVVTTYRMTAAELDRIQPYVEDVLRVYERLITHAILPSHQSGLQFPAPEHHHRSSTNNKFREDDAFFSMNKGGMTQKEIVENWIVEEPHKLENIPAENMDLRWMVIAVWGMGGLGKTTLVHEIFYRNSALRNQFDCFAWVTVSKTYKIIDLLRSMLKELEECGIREGDVFKRNEDLRNVNAMNEEQLICRIHQILHQKRYLVVFDDIWNNDFWTGIKHVFRKDHDRRSRILVTTRDEKVALSLAIKDRVMMLEPLEKEEAWRLFCAKAFWQEPEQKCPRELEDWARRIVDKCAGLPLAIVAAAGMMSTKDRDPLIWEKSCETVSLDLAETPKLSILRHSYYDLPPRLKQCFLYCSIFPEDYVINKYFLIRLWVAEGFIEEVSLKTLEEEAECYLKELIERSMIQVVEHFALVDCESYRIHDTFRMIILELSSEQKFSVTVDEEQNVKEARRLSICTNVQEINVPSLRSLSYFNLEGKLPLFNCKLLKVLQLENCHITNIPGMVFDLFNLRYLSLRNSKIEEYVFPERIERLQHLQTLDLYETNVKQLPGSVVKLQELRHLILSDDAVGAPVGIWKLKNLQTLGTVEATEDLIEHIGQLTNLRTLDISKVKLTHEEALQNSLKRLPHLEELVMNVHEGDHIDLVYLDPPPPRLHKFQLEGQLACIPMWFTSFSNLSALYLNDSRLKEEDDPLKYLRSLPRLARLELWNAYDGTSLDFPTNCFPKLKALYIWELPNLKSILIGKSAMPVLCRLSIWRCPSLAKPLPQVENLVKLEELYLEDLTAEVVQDFEEICSHCSHVKLYLYE